MKKFFRNKRKARRAKRDKEESSDERETADDKGVVAFALCSPRGFLGMGSRSGKVKQQQQQQQQHQQRQASSEEKESADTKPNANGTVAQTAPNAGSSKSESPTKPNGKAMSNVHSGHESSTNAAPVAKLSPTHQTRRDSRAFLNKPFSNDTLLNGKADDFSASNNMNLGRLPSAPKPRRDSKAFVQMPFQKKTALPSMPKDNAGDISASNMYDLIPSLEVTKLPRGGLSIETEAVGRIQVS